MNRESFGLHQSVTINANGLLSVWGRAVDVNKPFIILRQGDKEYVCFVTSDSAMGQIHDPR